MKLYFQKCREGASIPQRATPYSAGMDLTACLEAPVTLEPGQRTLIPTGLKAAPAQNDVVLLIYARSGLAIRHGITMANCVGVVDADYRGEICVPLVNSSDTPFTVEHGMRIAQLVVTPVILPECEPADTLPDTERGSGGFGSTGMQ